MRVPSARTERPTMRSGAPFGPEWVKGGCRRQADGTAGLPPAPEMPCAPRAVTLGATSGLMHRSKWSPIRLARRRGRAAAGRGSFKLAHRSPRFDFAQVNLSQTVKCRLPDSDRGRLPSTKRVTDVTQ